MIRTHQTVAKLAAVASAVLLTMTSSAAAAQWSESIEASGRLAGLGKSRVLRLSDGSHVVAWQGTVIGRNEYVLQARRVNPSGGLGPIVDIARGPISDRGLWRMASAADGNVRFVWDTFEHGGYPRIDHMRQFAPNGALSPVQDVFLPIYESHFVGSVEDFVLMEHRDGSSIVAGLGYDSNGPLLRLRHISPVGTMDPITDVPLDGTSAWQLVAAQTTEGATTLLWGQDDYDRAQPDVPGPHAGIRLLRVDADGMPSTVRVVTSDGSARAHDLAVAQDGFTSVVWATQQPNEVIGQPAQFVIRTASFAPNASLPSTTVDVSTEVIKSNVADDFTPLITTAGGDALAIWSGSDGHTRYVRTRTIQWASGGGLSATQQISNRLVNFLPFKGADGSIVLTARQGTSDPLYFWRINPDGARVVLPNRQPDADVDPDDRGFQNVDDLAAGSDGDLALVWAEPDRDVTDGAATIQLSLFPAPPRPEPVESDDPAFPAGDGPAISPGDGLGSTFVGSDSTRPPGTSSDELVAPSCPRLQVIGVRGSGEDLVDGPYSGFGRPARKFYWKLRDLTKGRYGKFWTSSYLDDYALPYAAVGAQWGPAMPFVYAQSVHGGKEKLLAYLRSRFFTTDCPKTRIILTGYSQGAQVIGDALESSKLTTVLLKRILAVVLFGDPTWNPGEPKVLNLGSWDVRTPPLTGILGARKLKSLRGASSDYKVYSYCDHEDPICQGWGHGKAGTSPITRDGGCLAVHNGYHKTRAAQAARSVFKLVRSNIAP